MSRRRSARPVGAEPETKPALDPKLAKPPQGLAASTFSVGADEYVIFTVPLPEVAIPPGLTRAEEAVVRAILDGKSNVEIARVRRTSVHTVANQLHSIYSKLGVAGRTALVQRCLAESGARRARDKPR